MLHKYFYKQTIVDFENEGTTIYLLYHLFMLSPIKDKIDFPKSQARLKCDLEKTIPPYMWTLWRSYYDNIILGLWTCEQLRYDPDTGRLLDNTTWHYHVPTCYDIPAEMRTNFYNSGNKNVGVLGSKTTGEPSVLAGSSVLFALR